MSNPDQPFPVVGSFTSGGVEIVTGRPVAGDIWKPLDMALEQGPAKIARYDTRVRPLHEKGEVLETLG